MSRSTWIIGVGMTPFFTPRNSPNYVELGARAIREALADAGLDYARIEQVFAGYVYGDSCSGHRVAYEVGLSGVPIFNVNSNCSSGSSALHLARQAVASGAAELALAVGFEQMASGALVEHWADRPSPLERFTTIADRWLDGAAGPMAPKLFGAAGREYGERYGVDADTFGQITVKSRRHAANNPRAVFRDPLTIEEVMASPTVCQPLTRFQCCPPTSGAAAALIASEAFARRHGMARAVRMGGQALVTDRPSSFEGSAIDAVGYRIGCEAAERAFQEAGVGADEIDVAEVHDCFTVNEILAYEALGLCRPGGASEFVASGANTYGGRCVTNPSGGLISKGHPLGATGLAQCFELVTQLRGEAQARQVADARNAVAHNIGIGSTCVVTVYQAGKPAH
jgi:acetyl-CoA acetyltransferase